MKFTGERLVPGIPRLENMIVEELARLNLVRSCFANSVVLDAGCGVGHGTNFVAENGARWVLGVDISVEAVSCATESYWRDHLAFGAMDCTRLALRDDSFDVVCSIELIEHLAETDRYLAEVCRVLKPDGRYVLSTPNCRISSTSGGKASWAFHVHEFDLAGLCSLLNVYFDEMEVWGAFVPVYEQHPIRRITDSPLSWIKHVLPPLVRVWVSSLIRFWIKPELSFDDVVFSKNDIENAHTFVALCGRKRPFGTSG